MRQLWKKGKNRLHEKDWLSITPPVRKGVLSTILKEGIPMLRNLTLCACAMVAILLLSSDASACGRRHARGCGSSCGGCVTAYSGCGTGCGYGGGCGAGVGYGYGGGYGAGVGYGYGGGYGAGYGYGGGYGYRGGYNPGGLGGPRSGLGVRPGPGFGGLGPRR
jgi:hypothetical protein